MAASILRRLFMCPLGLCESFVPRDDDHALWGECWRCGKVAGKIDRSVVREYLDVQYADEDRCPETRARHGGL